MTLFEDLLGSVTTWLEAIDRERDRALCSIGRRGRTPELQAWLDRLDGERTKHCVLMGTLDELQRAHHPALLFPARPTRSMQAGQRGRRRAS